VKETYNTYKSIKLARIKSCLSQDELAKKIGVSNRTISAYETGRAIPPTKILTKIAEATDSSVTELLGLIEEKSELQEKLNTIESRLSSLTLKVAIPSKLEFKLLILDPDNRLLLLKKNDKWQLPHNASGTLASLKKDVNNLLLKIKMKSSAKSIVSIFFYNKTQENIYLIKTKTKEAGKNTKKKKWLPINEFKKLDFDLTEHLEHAITNPGLDLSAIKVLK